MSLPHKSFAPQQPLLIATIVDASPLLPASLKHYNFASISFFFMSIKIPSDMNHI